MTPREATDDHHPQHAPKVLLDWVRLAVKYQYASLGNDITEQTRLALADVVTFMEQPAEAYCREHYAPCKYHNIDAKETP